MNKKLITISAAGLLLVAALGFGIYKMLERTPAVPITNASASTQPEIVLSSESEAAAPAPVSSSSSIPPIVAPSSSANAVEPEAKPAPQPNVVTSAPNGDGGKDVAVSRPEYSRPPDDETIYDEPKDKDKDNGSSTPDAPQGGNNGNTPKPEEKPQGGNGGQGGGKPGQQYVPGFGWVDPPAGVEMDTAHNAGTGEVIGE